MQLNPKIKLPLTSLDKALETIGIALTLTLWGLSIFSFIQLPTIIPIHFNAVGEVDDYGSKITLIVLPILGTLLYIALSFLNKRPHIFNYLVTITEENAVKQYTYATSTIRFLKISIVLIFNIAILSTYLTSVGFIKGLGLWFIPFIFGLTFIPIAYYIYKSFKTK